MSQELSPPRMPATKTHIHRPMKGDQHSDLAETYEEGDREKPARRSRAKIAWPHEQNAHRLPQTRFCQVEQGAADQSA